MGCMGKNKFKRQVFRVLSCYAEILTPSLRNHDAENLFFGVRAKKITSRMGEMDESVEEQEIPKGEEHRNAARS